MRPLCARDWWQTYARFIGNAGKNDYLLGKIHEKKLIAMGTLEETWPHRKWHENGSVVEMEKKKPRSKIHTIQDSLTVALPMKHFQQEISHWNNQERLLHLP